MRTLITIMYFTAKHVHVYSLICQTYMRHWNNITNYIKDSCL